MEREGGAFWRNEAISDYWDADSRFKVFDSGAVEYTAASGETETWGGDPEGDVLADYTEGPHVSEVLYSVYTDQNTAVLALTEGEVDLLLNPLGLQSGLRNEVLAAPSLDVTVNEENGFRYLAFNTRKFPMDELAFRQALACRIDKEFMTDTVLGGSAGPIDSLVPPGYAFWHNPDITAQCSGQSDQERLESAVAVLEEAGWTWDVKPAWDEDNLDVIPKGEGLRGPGGEDLPPLTLLAPGPGYDPMRATYSLFIEEWASDLGIPLSAEPTGFSVIVDKVVTGDPLEWDMYILGWSVTPFPDHVFEFFVSSADSAEGGYNTTGYSNPEFDELADQFNKAKTLEEARGDSTSGRRDDRPRPPLRGVVHLPGDRGVLQPSELPLHHGARRTASVRGYERHGEDQLTIRWAETEPLVTAADTRRTAPLMTAADTRRTVVRGSGG